MRHLLTLLLLCIGSLVSAAPPTAVITGPEQGYAGDLVILSWGTSTGDQFKLITPAKLDGKILLNSTDRQLGFSTREQDDYDFILIAVDKDLNIVHTIKTVHIGHGPQPPPPTNPDVPAPPSPPDTPPQPPANYLTELTKFVKQQTAKVNEPATAAAIAKAIRDIAPKMKNAGSRQEAIGMASLEIEKTLLKRPRQPGGADWLNNWRIPVNMEINRIQSMIVTPADAAAVMLAVADGLSQ